MRLRRAVLILLCSARAAAAQTTTDTARVIPDSRLFHRGDLYTAALFTAATIGMFPLDRHMASVFRDEDLVTNQKLNETAKAFRFFGGSGPYLIGGSMYVVGRLAHVPRAADLGLHGTEALLVGATMAGVLKAALGRERPYASADTNPRNFKFGRGLKGGEWMSFPSGHSTTAFAAAAAVSTETAVWWPKTKWIIGPILYGGATLVGLSRIYHDRHWASDVVMGAAVGTFAGQKTVRFNKTHAGNRLDRWFLGKANVMAHLSVTQSVDGSPMLVSSWVF
jgi:membrane-associated phospholipid phosphatase